jgi:uncharacterized glyoxalase superfamily protein PhnB
MNSNTRTLPVAVNHAGLTVPDVFAALDWYEETFGATQLMEPRLLDVTGHEETRSALGPNFKTA